MNTNNVMDSLTSEDIHFILNCIDDGVFITDGEGNIITLNDKSLSGMDRNQLIGKNMKDLIAAGVYNESIALKVIENGTAQTMLQHETGVDLLTTAIPYYKDGKIFMVILCEKVIDEIEALRNKLYESEEKNSRYIQELQNIRASMIKQDVIANSASMKQVIQLVKIAAHSDATVLVTGETGSGKEVVTKLIHQYGSRHDKPFIAVNCAAIPETLFESELFGYEAGAFTGAGKSGKKGYFELASGGVLFLDEIGDISLSSQVKLLRAIQEKEIMRVGGTVKIPVDSQLIVATNKNLSELVKQGKFRSDLYFRLSVFPIEIPPLRKRVEDIPELINFFLKKFNKKYNCNKTISTEAIKMLLSYDWPGNIRELENMMERLLLICTEDVIDQNLVMSLILKIDMKPILAEGMKGIWDELTESFERELLTEFAKKYNSVSDMMDALKISRATINRKISKYNLRKYLK